MFGQIRPIVVDEQHVILAGNGLYDTMLTLGRETADCFIVTGLSENEKKKLVLADNRIFSLGTDDLSAFDAMVNDLKDDLDIPGFDDDLLQSLINEDLLEIEAVHQEGQWLYSSKVKDKIILMACKAAVKGGQTLTNQEMQGLLEGLMMLDNPFTCPHGRPIITRLREYELMKLFKRVV